MKPLYPSDLSDAQWQKIAPLLPVERAAGRVGRPRKYTNRQIVNAILYLIRTGCQWRYLPREYPPYGCVLWYFRRWRDDATLDRVHDALRAQAREQVGKEPTPSVVLLDSQSVKAGEKGAIATRQKPQAMTRASTSKDASATSLWTRWA